MEELKKVAEASALTNHKSVATHGQTHALKLVLGSHLRSLLFSREQLASEHLLLQLMSLLSLSESGARSSCECVLALLDQDGPLRPIRQSNFVHQGPIWHLSHLELQILFLQTGQDFSQTIAKNRWSHSVSKKRGTYADSTSWV